MSFGLVLLAALGLTIAQTELDEAMVLLQKRAEFTEQAKKLDDLSADSPDPADFSLGVNGTTACPLGFRNIDSENKCRMAKNALALPGPWRRKDTWPLKPYGCFTDPSGDLYINTNTSGAGLDGHVPVCEKDTVELGNESSSVVADSSPLSTGDVADTSSPGSDRFNLSDLGDLDNAEAGSPEAGGETIGAIPAEPEIVANGFNLPTDASSTMSDLDAMEAEIEQAHRAAEEATAASDALDIYGGEVVGEVSNSSDEFQGAGNDALTASTASVVSSLASTTQDREKQIVADALAKLSSAAPLAPSPIVQAVPEISAAPLAPSPVVQAVPEISQGLASPSDAMLVPSTAAPLETMEEIEKQIIANAGVNALPLEEQIDDQTELVPPVELLRPETPVASTLPALEQTSTEAVPVPPADSLPSSATVPRVTKSGASWQP